MRAINSCLIDTFLKSRVKTIAIIDHNNILLYYMREFLLAHSYNTTFSSEKKNFSSSDLIQLQYSETTKRDSLVSRIGICI